MVLAINRSASFYVLHATINSAVIISG